MKTNNYILNISCKDTSGIVSTVSTYLFGIGGFITEASQFGDEFTGRFFLRTEFSCKKPLAEIKKGFQKIADKFKMEFEFYDVNKKPKIIIAVSKASHCLSHLLNKHEIGALNADIVGIVSNHSDLKNWADRFKIKFHHLKIEKNKKEQEQKLLELYDRSGAELLVLARYMQILSDNACKKLKGHAINIHHSFLPSFKGAKPYQQAYDRGVKIIGATAHYVTPDLDEGPIIEQEVTRVDHSCKPEDLKLTGEDIESNVLFRAIKWHLEHRVILNGNKTVIFK
jgi:formyltetrahydrofolate deformylase